MKDLVLGVKVDLKGCTLASSKFMDNFATPNVALVAECNACVYKSLFK
jgi:hypothetical protein